MGRPQSPAMLGVLTLRPMSGYEIRKFIARSLGYFWKESYGQIYPSLKRLAAAGLARPRTERNRGKPDRQVYSLTPRGRVELQRWLAQAPHLRPPRNELLLKLFFGRWADPADLVSHLRVFRDHQRELLRQYREIDRRLRREHAAHLDCPYWLLTLDFGIRESRMRLAWCEHSLQTLTRLAKSRAA